MANAPSFPLRHAVLHLSRPGNQTRVILLAVGLGAFFIVGVRSLEANLLSEFSIQVGNDSADMFLLDIQRNQVEGMRQFFADPANRIGTSRLIPVLRARVTGVSGRITTLESFEDVRARGSLAREYTVTYRDHLEANERVLEGTFWNSPSTCCPSCGTVRSQTCCRCGHFQKSSAWLDCGWVTASDTRN